MSPDEFAKLLRNPALSSFAPQLRSIARPCVDIQVGKRKGGRDKSRFGGQPYVPRDFEWPQHDVGEYRFLGQFNFADIESPPSAFPSSGLLCLFYAATKNFDIDLDTMVDDEVDALMDAEEVEIFWRDPGFVVAYYWDSCDGFQLLKGNAAETKCAELKLTAGVDLPRHQELRHDWPFDDEVSEIYFEEVSRIGEKHRNYLLGYPSFTTLAYDPTPNDSSVSLLTVASILDWHWHDGDKLMVFIECEKLAKLDFGQLACDAG